MQYALFYFETPTEIARRNGPDAAGYWASWTSYFAMIREKTEILSGNALQPGETKTVVRQSSNGRVVEDGPFADAREELGGYVILDLANLDEALALAEGAPCASAGGFVEVRPVLMMSAAEEAA